MIYARIEDDTGKSVTVVNADAVTTANSLWQEWAISYSDLAGVNPSRVQKTAIGVGSRTSTTAGGTVHIDGISFGRPAAAE